MNINKTLFEIVAQYTASDIADLSVTTDFVDLGTDSLELLEIVVEVEDAFCITLHNDEVNDIKTIGDMISCVEIALDR